MDCSQIDHLNIEPERLRWFQAVACLACVVVAVLITIANLGLGHHFQEFIANLPGRDKTIHFFVFGGLAMLLSIAMRLLAAQFGRLRIFHGVLLVVFISTAEEFSQLMFATRTFDWADLISNYSGIAFFGAITGAVARRQGWITTP